MLKRFEVDFANSGAGPNDTLSAKLFDRSLAPILQEFINQFPPRDHYIHHQTNEYDDYWLDYRHNFEPIKKLRGILNLYLWIATSNLEDLKQLAEHAAKQIEGATLFSFRKSGEETYEITFKITDKKTSPFRIPYDIMDNAALNGQDNLEEDVSDLFVALLVKYQMKNIS